MDTGYYHAIKEESTQSVRDTFLAQSVVWFLWFANIYDMGGGFGIKYVSFAAAVLYLLLHFSPFPMDRPTSHTAICLFLVWPVLSLFLGVVSGADIALATSQITPFIAAIVFMLVIQSVNPTYTFSVFFSIMYSLAISIIVIYCLMWFPNTITDYIVSLLSSDAHGYIGFRPFGDIILPNVYFKATLFLVPTYVYFLYRAKLIKALIILLALVLAFSKAGFAICMVFTLCYLFFHETKMYFKIALVVVILGMVPGLLNFNEFTEELLLSLSGKSETSQVRIGYIEPLKVLFDESPWSLLIGQGAGALFYAQNMGGYVSNLEVDYLNAIRKFGLPWFLTFTIFVLGLSRKLMYANIPDDRIIGLALLASFIAAGTNPVLISPPFLMFMMMSLDAYWRSNETVS